MTFQEIINQDKPVLIDFYATWCGPCKMMGPILEEVKRQVGENASLLKLDVDKNPALASQYQIQGVPTLILFKGGQQLWRQSGVVQPHDLVALIQQHL